MQKISTSPDVILFIKKNYALAEQDDAIRIVTKYENSIARRMLYFSANKLEVLLEQEKLASTNVSEFINQNKEQFAFDLPFQQDNSLLSGKYLWQELDNKLVREFLFQDFVDAFAFMARVAKVAEQQGHHPNWYNVYNYLKIELTTHDMGNIVTEKDLELAQAINTCLI